MRCPRWLCTPGVQPLRHMDLRRQPVYCVHQSPNPPAGHPAGPLTARLVAPPSGSPCGPQRGLPCLPGRPATPGAGRLTTGQPGAFTGLLASGTCGRLACGGVLWASCPIGLVGSGGTRDDRRRPGHRAGEVYGRAGVDGCRGWHGHTPMGPWGWVYVCPELAATLSEQGKTQGYAISEGSCVSEQGKIPGKSDHRGSGQGRWDVLQ
jgi:hypothetical protein